MENTIDLRQWTHIDYYQYPDQSDPLIKLASAVGRAFYDKEKYGKNLAELKKHMAELSTAKLLYWKDVLLIRPEWDGASGTGAYIAVASRVVNEIATELLQIKCQEWKEKYGNAMFVVKEKGVDECASE